MELVAKINEKMNTKYAFQVSERIVLLLLCPSNILIGCFFIQNDNAIRVSFCLWPAEW